MTKAKSQSFAQGAEYNGPKAIFDGPEVGFVRAFYAIAPLPEGHRDADGNLRSGTDLLMRGDKPVRLMQVDMAPGDPDDGKEKFFIAGSDDPPQSTIDGREVKQGRIVSMEPEAMSMKSRTSA